MNESVQYWLGLTRLQGLGTRGALKLVRAMGSPERVYAASLTELESCGVSSRIAQDIFAQRGLAEAEREITLAASKGFEIVTPSDGDYPALLNQIPDPPLALYVLGDRAVLSAHAVAMVGTRRPSAYGSSVAHRLASDLALRQVVIVSGLARGVDSAAHRGALEAKGKTVAVLGSGLDIIYPRENKKLAEKAAQNGAVISEFPLGAAPTPENFPIRNRIISGLSLGVVIVEAAEYSGSLITARLALEQNREVFAVPGNITSPQSFGPNLLIKQGAKLVDQWMDVIEELPPSVRMQLTPASSASDESHEAVAAMLPLAQALGGDEKTVFETLRVDEALFVDAISGQTSLPQPRVLAALLGLEMGGWVRQLPGMNFVRKL
ncbi:MAG: DNA-processing protein DprA [Acidobacteriota bacterium]|nr:DNA-processing protein DprA [Acidobacteriota bacterium]